MAFVLHEDEDAHQSPRIAAFDVERPLTKPAPRGAGGKRAAADASLAPPDK
jgi:hypothetical protein